MRHFIHTTEDLIAVGSGIDAREAEIETDDDAAQGVLGLPHMTTRQFDKMVHGDKYKIDVNDWM